MIGADCGHAVALPPNKALRDTQEMGEGERLDNNRGKLMLEKV